MTSTAVSRLENTFDTNRAHTRRVAQYRYCASIGQVALQRYSYLYAAGGQLIQATPQSTTTPPRYPRNKETLGIQPSSRSTKPRPIAKSYVVALADIWVLRRILYGIPATPYAAVRTYYQNEVLGCTTLKTIDHVSLCSQVCQYQHRTSLKSLRWTLPYLFKQPGMGRQIIPK